MRCGMNSDASSPRVLHKALPNGRNDCLWASLAAIFQLLPDSCLDHRLNLMTLPLGYRISMICPLRRPRLGL
jgi:hypothetical protein